MSHWIDIVYNRAQKRLEKSGDELCIDSPSDAGGSYTSLNNKRLALEPLGANREKEAVIPEHSTTFFLESDKEESKKIRLAWLNRQPTKFYIFSHIGPFNQPCSKVGITHDVHERINAFMVLKKDRDKKYRIFATFLFPDRARAAAFEKHIYSQHLAHSGREYLYTSPKEVFEFCCQEFCNLGIGAENIWVCSDYYQASNQ